MRTNTNTNFVEIDKADSENRIPVGGGPLTARQQPGILFLLRLFSFLLTGFIIFAIIMDGFDWIKILFLCYALFALFSYTLGTKYPQTRYLIFNNSGLHGYTGFFEKIDLSWEQVSSIIRHSMSVEIKSISGKNYSFPIGFLNYHLRKYVLPDLFRVAENNGVQSIRTAYKADHYE